MRITLVANTALSLLALVTLSGCLGDNRRPIRQDKRPPAVPVKGIPGVDGPLPDKWQRVFVGQLPRPKLCGYLRTEEVVQDRTAYLVHWVYDEEFQLVGLLSDNGRTTKYDRFGRAESMGILPHDQGLLAIYGYSQLRDNPVRFTSMPTPKE